MPEFSPKIKVVQDTQAILANGRTWDVTCTGIELINKDASLGGLGYAEAKFIPFTPAAPASADPVPSNSNARPVQGSKQGLRILLDTGSSVSWLPPHIIRQIAAHYGDHTIRMRQSTKSVTGPEFIVPKKGQTSLHKVALYFEGLDGNTVRVEVLADQFIYGAHPETGALEGLMFSTENRCVFGLNWFHANWVKMCAPRDEEPYVQLALQEHVPFMVVRHQLPPKEKETS
ncbi:uncharacterized protein TRAVEDRAFT_29878 [Trametes versicolor FP-101664 SS1]|uniref:uncharacterized protein n=1 Tax=Trametes versicolor (strain FP-101664) TaxID=717944 RepID=UPI00046240E8|nr:uncharacterized protein TRAVEDRAFT_29878 [Trametes versicolor FP-101664 SS1]EIW58043.1 hypothetical protein TRAVEDRAFT_29878 [Trametes versicolor FP-101664 SS1]